MSVILKNTRHQAFYATYYTEVTGRRTTDRLYDVRKVRSPAGKIVSEKQPHSFMVPALEQETVHDVALHLPQVKAALKSGWLVKVEAKAAAAPPPASASGGASSSESAPAMSAASSGGNGGRRSRRGR